MKRVAIIGAGSSGMACACRLEQLGFEGRIDIFEKKEGPQQGNIQSTLIAEFINRPIKDPLLYLFDKYGLEVKPAATIYHSINHGPKTKAEFRGFLGYVMLRGGHPDSLENQLRRQVRTEVQYGKQSALEDLGRKYDCIVIATGNWDYVPQLVSFRIEAHVSFHYAVVSEKSVPLNPNQFEMWFNSRYAPVGYAYRIPLTGKRAMMTCTGVISKNRDPVTEGWERFKQEQIAGKYEILEEHRIRNYLLGKPDRLRVGRFFLTGANTCCNNPLFGFGQFNSLLSGIYAAEAITLGRDYEKSMEVITRESVRGSIMFKRLHSWGDFGYDLIVRAGATGIARRVVKAGGPDVLGPLGRIAEWTYFGGESRDVLTSGERVCEVEHVSR